ncbi:MAG: DUF1016 N-terminal domain-containing protein [Clostridiales bacterium]|nr:DUF1016 N-terminal domain-containing protein [Clostridiales bacterium]
MKSDKENSLTVQLDELNLFARVSAIIGNRKLRAQARANQEAVLMFWEIGHYIGSVLLGGERAAYGKQIVVTLAQQLSWSHITGYRVIRA